MDLDNHGLPQDALPVSFILTANRTRAKPFYAGALGLPILAEDDFAVTFGLGNGATIRLAELPGHEAGGQTVLGWRVNDIGVAVARLEARGITFLADGWQGQDARGIWSSPDGLAKVAWFADPDGNRLSLTEFAAP